MVGGGGVGESERWLRATPDYMSIRQSANLHFDKSRRIAMIYGCKHKIIYFGDKSKCKFAL